MASLLESALALAADGHCVFPVGATDKKPRCTNGFHDATSDPEQIKRWDWSEGTGIAVAIPEGQFVVDVDVQHGGQDTVKALISGGLKFPATKVVTTQSGGSHRYYRLPVEHHGRRLKGSLGPGIDCKAAGKGYVLAPPTPGYKLQFDRDPVEAPEWMVAELLAPEGPDAEAAIIDGAPRYFGQWEKGTSYGLAALEVELERLSNAPEGSRNSTLNRSAFAISQLATGGELSADDSLLRLSAVAESIGLEPDEIKATLSSAWNAGALEPRQAPPREAAAMTADVRPSRPSFEPGPMMAEDVFYWLNWQEEEDPPPFYLHPIVPKNAYVIVYGATESSKSMVFMALAAQASHRGIKTSVYSLENPSIIDRDRARRLAPDPAHFRITNQPIDMNDARQVMDLVERNRPGGHGSWADGRGTDWIIIDTYSHAFNSRSEDGNAKAIEFSRRVRFIMHEVGCTVILVDHTGYQQAEEPRDASAKRQQVDVALYMQKVGQWAPGAPARFSMSNRKSARFANPFHITGEITDVRPQERGLDLRWLAERPVWEVTG